MPLRFPNLTQKELAQLAIDNHLYVDGWDILRHYETIRDGKRVSCEYALFVAFEGTKPIAACTVCENSHQIAVFVNENARGKGIGSKLIKRALKETGLKENQVFAGLGIEGSKDFFAKNKIVSFEDACIPLTKEQTEDFIHHRKSYKELLLERIQCEYDMTFATKEI